MGGGGGGGGVSLCGHFSFHYIYTTLWIFDGLCDNLHIFFNNLFLYYYSRRSAEEQPKPQAYSKSSDEMQLITFNQVFKYNVQIVSLHITFFATLNFTTFLG